MIYNASSNGLDGSEKQTNSKSKDEMTGQSRVGFEGSALVGTGHTR